MSGKQYGIEHTSRTFHITYEEDDLVEDLAAAAGLSAHDWFVDLIRGATRAAAMHEQRTQQRLAEVEAEHRRREREQQQTYNCMECKWPVRPGTTSMQFLSKHRGHANCMAARTQDREWKHLRGGPRAEEYLVATVRIFGDGTAAAEAHIEPLARLSWFLRMGMTDVAHLVHEFPTQEDAIRELERRASTTTK